MAQDVWTQEVVRADLVYHATHRAFRRADLGTFGAAFFGSRLMVASLAARSLLAFDPKGGDVQQVFNSGDRLRAALPVRDALYVITTNTSPRANAQAARTDF